MAEAYGFRGRDSFPPDKVGKIDTAIAGLPESARNYLVNARVPVIYLPQKEIESMPPELKSRLFGAKAVAWNHGRINVPENQVDNLTSSDLEHELAHMAYADIPADVKAKAKARAIELGRRIVEFARKRKGTPEDMSLTAKQARGHMAMLTRKTTKGGKPRDYQFGHELSLMIPPYQYREIAQHLGLDTPEDDQYATICVNLYLSERNKLGLFLNSEAEEILAYLVGTDRKFADHAFDRANEKLRLDTEATTLREGRLDAYATQTRRSPMAQRVDCARRAKTVLSPSQSQRWKKRPNRCDIEGIDTPRLTK